MGTKLPRGINARKSSSGIETIYLTFTYRGIFCRESLGIPLNQKNIRYAEELITDIRFRIKRGTFEFNEFFPDSRSRAAKLFGKSRSNVTIHDLFKEVNWPDIVPKLTTADTYRKDAKWADEWFNDMPVTELSVKDVRDWIKSMDHLSRKTISNRLIPLKTVLALAVDDELIPANPCNGISLGTSSKGLISRKQRESKYKIDPFDIDEIEAILNAAETYDIQAKNYFQAMFYTGMRPSESKGLCWTTNNIDNIDFENGLLDIKSTLVSLGSKNFKQEPKTIKSLRVIELTPKGLEALEAQAEITKGHSKYVFNRFDGGEGHLQHNDHYYRPWRTILELADVRYRPPYQTRHTFASNLLSGGENIWFVAKQMGHVDPEMILKTYGKWIKKDRHSKHRYVSDYGQ